MGTEKKRNTLLIRSEDKNRWERRSPLVPADVREIVKSARAEVFVQKSDKRFFTEEDYTGAGAKLCEDMGPGDVIVGVKEIPEEKILDNKTYIFFSHTIKGQKSGMPLLKRIIKGKSTLIDYERICDEEGGRLIFFGRYAGDAGAIDILALMGEHWQDKGIETPFSEVKTALHYRGVDHAKAHLKKVGKAIRERGFPPELSPMVIGVLGYGNVSSGAQQIFDCLPTTRITPEALEELSIKGKADPRTVYLTVFKEEEMVERKDDAPFDLSDYYNNPENYVSRFDRYLPHITILVNAVYWEKRYPRFVTWDSLSQLFKETAPPKLSGIADITCDTNGSIECNVKSTDSGCPAYRCDPLTRSVSDGHKGEGIVLLAVDNLPAELPNDSSTFFSRQFKPFLPGILHADLGKSLDESGLPPEVKRGVIVYRGELTPDYAYLKEFL